MSTTITKQYSSHLSLHDRSHSAGIWRQLAELQKKVRLHWKTKKTSAQILREERGR